MFGGRRGDDGETGGQGDRGTRGQGEGLCTLCVIERTGDLPFFLADLRDIR